MTGDAFVGYGRALDAYKAAGWRGVLPLPPLAKSPPPKGTTGREGRWPSTADEMDWRLSEPEDGNVALRLPPDVVGLDVDQYGEKAGYDNLLDFTAAEGLPPLPPTWRSSARAGPSGILFYRVPAGTRLRGEAVPNVETIQHHHRFAVVWPSIHPDEGAPYLWSFEGELSARVPGPEDFATLPPAWVEALADQPEAYATEARPLPEARLETEWSPAVATAWREQADRIFTALEGSRHEIANGAALALLRLEQAGEAGATNALDRLGRLFVELVEGSRGGEDVAAAEWRRLVDGGRLLVASTETVALRKAHAERELLEELVGPADTLSTNLVEFPYAPYDGTAPDDNPHEAALIEWSAFWRRDRAEADFLVDPLLARGRSHALFAGPKSGKSLLTLEVAAALATGRPVLDEPAGEAVDVIYLDLEMTEDDIYERLVDLGYSEADDLSRLHYYLLPDLPPLDTELGGLAVEGLVNRHGASLVIVDTTSRVIAGPENEADTFRAFYRHTGTRLKRLGVTYVRLDHTGKDPTKGQRGSSAKADDVDVVWSLVVADEGVHLTATHRRIAWVRETVDLKRRLDPLRHVTVRKAWPHGTREAAERLDELEAPLDISGKAAEALLREQGGGARRQAVLAAVKYRREEAELRDAYIGNPPGNPLAWVPPEPLSEP